MLNKQTPIIIDVESSGFGKGSYPIEIGIALADHSTHCFLIKPAEGWEQWNEESEQLHKISRETLQTRGRDITEVADELNALLKGKTVYSDGWGMDNSWIGLLYDTAERWQHFKVAQLQALFNEQQYDNWHDTYKEIQQQLNITRHRASSDALVIQKTYLNSR